MLLKKNIYKFTAILCVLAIHQVNAATFVNVSCYEKRDSICSDSSVLKIYARKFERECKKRKGIFKFNIKCNTKNYHSAYCGIKDYNFQIYYSPQYYKYEDAKKHCQNQRVGAHQLGWIKP